MLDLSTLFDNNYYLSTNPDVANAVNQGFIADGFSHYVQYGQFENRNPTIYFDASAYLSENLDVASAVTQGFIGSAVQHFLQHGQREGRDPTPWFDTQFYLQQYADVAAAVQRDEITGIQHFIQFGQFEGRNPSDFFETSVYLNLNPDVQTAVSQGGITAFSHFLRFGQFEGRGDALNSRVIQGFFDSFLNNTVFQYIDNNFTRDVQYLVVGTEAKLFGAEREAVLPHGGLYQGPAGAKYFFELTATEREVLGFNVEKVLVQGNSGAVFGDFLYRSPATGDDLGTDWAINIEMRNGKIAQYHFFEDTYAVAAGYRDKSQGLTWEREFDGKSRQIQIGTSDDDDLVSDNSTDLVVFLGYGGNDSLVGGNGDDFLEGGKGNDTLTGGAGSDRFILFPGDGTDTVTDFTIGQDKVVIRGGLTFNDIQAQQDGANTLVKVLATGEVLASLTNVQVANLTQSDFEFDIPRLAPITDDPTTTEQSAQVVTGFFNSFLDGTVFQYIDNNFTEDVEYLVVGTESELFGSEREAVLPHSGLYKGREGAKYFFILTESEREVLNFQVDKVVAQGNSVAAFGSFLFRSPDTGDLLETDWATHIELRDGKVARYHFFEDAYAVASGYRRKEKGFEWLREFDGQERRIQVGTKNNDFLTSTGSQDLDVLFGYDGSDTLIAGDGDDIIYGGAGDDFIEGGVGNDAITGGSGSDLFVLEPGHGTDTIADFEAGVDQFLLRRRLTFAKLSITQVGDSTEIRNQQTGELLAVLPGVMANSLTEDHFVV